MKNLFAAAAVTSAAIVASPAAAATVFSFNESASSVTVSPIKEGCVGIFFSKASCTLSADFASGASGYSFLADEAGDTDYVSNFIDWSIVLQGIKPTGAGLYNVAVDLVFSSPDTASGSASGIAGFGTLLGVLSAGGVSWHNGGVGSVSFADGSVLGFDLDEVLEGGLGTSTTSGIKFTAEAVAPVPLPAAGWLMLAGIGGMAAVGRKRERA